MHRLALALGSTVADVRKLPLDELNSWVAYDAAELLPDRRTELQLAQIAHVICCTHSRSPGNYRVQDFMPSQEAASQSPEDFLKGFRHG